MSCGVFWLSGTVRRERGLREVEGGRDVCSWVWLWLRRLEMADMVLSLMYLTDVEMHALEEGALTIRLSRLLRCRASRRLALLLGLSSSRL